MQARAGTRPSEGEASMGVGADVVQALRSLRRAPVHSVLVVGILALGLATTVAVYSVVAGVLLRPLPYESPDELVMIRQVDPELAHDLHASAPGKPFTVALLPRSERSRILEIRVTLLSSPLWQPLVQALLQQITRPALRLGSTALTVRDVPGTPGSHPWAGYASYAALAAAVVPADRLTLEFVTPTAITTTAVSATST